MRIACCQLDVAFADPLRNAERAEAEIERAGRDGVDLVVFPEAFLTGYVVETEAEARAIAIPLSHPAVERVGRAAEAANVMVICGLAERAADGALQNTAVLFEPGRPLRRYVKTHLPLLGLDRFVRPGDRLEPFDTRAGRIGIFVCFDLRPPEVARVLALRGADLLVLPTNWPVGAEMGPRHFAPVRASENRVALATCNRVGTENGFSFIGQSGIYDVRGAELAKAGAEEEVIVAEVDLSESRIKRNVIVPGKYETTVFECRRPELYESLTGSAASVGS